MVLQLPYNDRINTAYSNKRHSRKWAAILVKNNLIRLALLSNWLPVAIDFVLFGS